MLKKLLDAPEPIMLMDYRKILDDIKHFCLSRWYLGLAGVFLFLAVALVVQELDSIRIGGITMCDFEVYHRAAGRLLHGETLYQPLADGRWTFKYSPTAALLFTPLSMLPLWLADIFYWFILTGAVLLGFYLSLSLVSPDFRKWPGRSNALVLLAFLVMLPHIWTEFSLGQVNYLLLVSYVAVAWLFVHRKPAACGAVLAFSIFIKPYGLIVLPYFLVRRRFREAGWFALFSGTLFLLPAVFYTGGGFIAQQQNWWQNLLVELTLKKDYLVPGNHTIFSMLVRFSPLGSLDAASGFFRFYTPVLLGLIGLVALVIFYRGRKMRNREALDFALIFALVPLIAYTTDNAFGFTELAVILLLFNYGVLSRPERGLLAVALAFVAFDLCFFQHFDSAGWPSQLVSTWESNSLLGLGTVALVLIMSTNRLRARL